MEILTQHTPHTDADTILYVMCHRVRSVCVRVCLCRADDRLSQLWQWYDPLWERAVFYVIGLLRTIRTIQKMFPNHYDVPVVLLASSTGLLLVVCVFFFSHLRCAHSFRMWAIVSPTFIRVAFPWSMCITYPIGRSLWLSRNETATFYSWMLCAEDINMRIFSAGVRGEGWGGGGQRERANIYSLAIARASCMCAGTILVSANILDGLGRVRCAVMRCDVVWMS